MRLTCLTFLFLLTACTSNFRQNEHRFLSNQTESRLAQILIKGQTTRTEVEQHFGKLPSYQSCYQYDESHLPFYNFLPTNFLYMKSSRQSWRLCIEYDERQIVRDYRFSHEKTEDANSPAGSLVKDIFKSRAK